MYELYEKVRKSKDFLYGAKSVEVGTNPFLEGPCLLCVAATDTQDRSVFGVSKEGMQMARLRVRKSPNAKFDIKDFPVKFLSLKLSKDEINQQKSKVEQIDEFANKYFTPLISSNGKRIEVEDAMKNMRNVNIMSYCDGTLTVQQMEQFVVQKMQDLGYDENEIIKIQSQMCMIPVATSRMTGQQKSTCISFMDINDFEVNENVSDEEIKQVTDSPIKEALIKYSENESGYLMQGTGKHLLKEYQTNGKAMPVCLSSVVSKALENSINNFNNRNDFKPLLMEDLTSEIAIISEQAEQGVQLDGLRKNLDNSINYGDAKRLSDSEIELLDQLDESYDAIIKINKELKSKNNMLNYEKERSAKVDTAIKESCSDITYLKILRASGYQFGLKDKINEETVINSPTDRQIIMELQEKDNIRVVNPKEIAEKSREEFVTYEEVEESSELLNEISKTKEENIIS